MTNMIIVIIIGIAIAAIAGYSAITLWQGAQDGYEQQLLWARLEQTAAALKASIKIVDGLPVLPAPDITTTTYPIVPSWITSNAIDVSGNKFVYCPYALRPGIGTTTPATNFLEGTQTTVTGPGYNTIQYTSTVFDGSSHSYVIGSIKPPLTGTTAAAPKGLLGYLISFKPRDTYSATIAAQWCSATYPIVVSATGQLSTSASLGTSGIIYPIIAGQSLYQQFFAKSDTVTFYIGTAAAGDASGRNPTNQTTLDAAFAQLAALRPFRAKLYLTSGTHILSAVNRIATISPAPTITPGATAGSAVTFTASSALFAATDLGKVITNTGGTGIATITAYTDSTHVVAAITKSFPSTSAISSGSWTLSSDVYDKGNLRQIQYDVEGVGSGSTIINPGADFDLPVNMIWRSLTINSAHSYNMVVRPNNRWIVQDSILSNLVARNGEVWASGTSALNDSVIVTEGGRLVVKGTVTATVPNQGFDIQPGRVDILPSASLTVTATGTTGSPKAPVIVHAGAKLGISGAMTVTSDGSTTLQSGINVVPGGFIYMNGGTLTFNTGTGSIAGDTATRPGTIILGGKMYMDNSGLLFPGATATGVAAVALVDGGRFYMHNGSYIGASGTSAQRPYYGVYDNGGSAVGGSSTGYSSGAAGEGGSPQSNIYVSSGAASSLCWTGNSLPAAAPAAQRRHLFIDSPSGGTTGNVSTPQNTSSPNDYRHLVLQNQTNWKCTRN